jgi:hypothetical protein
MNTLASALPLRCNLRNSRPTAASHGCPPRGSRKIESEPEEIQVLPLRRRHRHRHRHRHSRTRHKNRVRCRSRHIQQWKHRVTVVAWCRIRDWTPRSHSINTRQHRSIMALTNLTHTQRHRYMYNSRRRRLNIQALRLHSRPSPSSNLPSPSTKQQAPSGPTPIH